MNEKTSLCVFYRRMKNNMYKKPKKYWEKNYKNGKKSVQKLKQRECFFDGKGWKIITDSKNDKYDELTRIRAHRICVHQTLAPGTPSTPGMPISPYGQHNIHTVCCFISVNSDLRSGDAKKASHFFHYI